LVKVLDEGDADAGEPLDMEAIYRSVHRATEWTGERMNGCGEKRGPFIRSRPPCGLVTKKEFTRWAE
jgi:hypothetical protein